MVVNVNLEGAMKGSEDGGFSQCGRATGCEHVRAKLPAYVTNFLAVSYMFISDEVGFVWNPVLFILTFNPKGYCVSCYPLVNIQKAIWKDPPFSMEKLTISMVIFNSYFDILPEGSYIKSGAYPMLRQTQQASWRRAATLCHSQWAKVLPMSASGFDQNTAEQTLAAILSAVRSRWWQLMYEMIVNLYCTNDIVSCWWLLC